jgi:Pyruvate/2-oxoacid:ferredoxin oxidoreductase gamma subunit
MVMLGAYVAVTGIVTMAALLPAVAEALPSYRAQHAARNVEAVEVGASFCAAIAGSHPAWTPAEVAAVGGGAPA